MGDAATGVRSWGLRVGLISSSLTPNPSSLAPHNSPDRSDRSFRFVWSNRHNPTDKVEERVLASRGESGFVPISRPTQANLAGRDASSQGETMRLRSSRWAASVLALGMSAAIAVAQPPAVPATDAAYPPEALNYSFDDGGNLYDDLGRIGFEILFP